MRVEYTCHANIYNFCWKLDEQRKLCLNVPHQGDFTTEAHGEIKNTTNSDFVERRNVKVYERKMQLGEYYPRVWRPGLYGESLASMLAGGIEVLTNSHRAAKLLVDRLMDIFSTVEPTQTSNDAYGHRIREVLLLACMEVEAAWSGVLRVNNYENCQGEQAEPRWSTNDYVKLRDLMQLPDFIVSFPLLPGIEPFRPFAGWKDANEEADNGPTKSLDWYNAYNATKHDRENSFSKATLASAIHAVGAVAVLLFAQFGPDKQLDGVAVKLDEAKPETFYLPKCSQSGVCNGGWTEVHMRF